MKVTSRLLALGIAMVACARVIAQQVPDPDFDASVKQKTYTREHPRVVIDEAHHNLHTAGGSYAPLAQLLTNDGYDVQPGTEKFQPQTLRSVRVLIVADARGEGATGKVSPSAFTEAECDIVSDWVSGGGSLLLIADHAPFAEAASELSKRFGVSMGKGIVFDTASFETAPTFVVFTGDTLGAHPIIKGRNASERVKRVVSFGGQSLSVPGIGIALLKFGATAYASDNQSELALALDSWRNPGSAGVKAFRYATPAAGRAQAVALVLGRGRVVVLGEAGMLSAQILGAQQTAGADVKLGMNAPGNDDRQLALNVLHWLSAAL